MAISANLGRDTDYNSTKLVCDHPLVSTLAQISPPSACYVCFAKVTGDQPEG